MAKFCPFQPIQYRTCKKPAYAPGCGERIVIPHYESIDLRAETSFTHPPITNLKGRLPVKLPFKRYPPTGAQILHNRFSFT